MLLGTLGVNQVSVKNMQSHLLKYIKSYKSTNLLLTLLTLYNRQLNFVMHGADFTEDSHCWLPGGTYDEVDGSDEDSIDCWLLIF